MNKIIQKQLCLDERHIAKQSLYSGILASLCLVQISIADKHKWVTLHVSCVVSRTIQHHQIPYFKTDNPATSPQSLIYMLGFYSTPPTCRFQFIETEWAQFQWLINTTAFTSLQSISKRAISFLKHNQWVTSRLKAMQDM